MRRLRLLRRGFARQIASLERFKQLQMALNVALDHGDEIQRGLLGVIQPLLLGVQLLIQPSATTCIQSRQTARRGTNAWPG